MRPTKRRAGNTPRVYAPLRRLHVAKAPAICPVDLSELEGVAKPVYGRTPAVPNFCSCRCSRPGLAFAFDCLQNVPLHPWRPRRRPLCSTCRAVPQGRNRFDPGRSTHLFIRIARRPSCGRSGSPTPTQPAPPCPPRRLTDRLLPLSRRTPCTEPPTTWPARLTSS